MKHEHNRRLNTALASMVGKVPQWIPPPGERERVHFGRTKMMTRYDATLRPDHQDAEEASWLAVAQEQGTAPLHWPNETIVYRHAKRQLMDWILAAMDEETCARTFEAAALTGDDAEDDLLPDSESVGLPKPFYSVRWVRVPDEIFAQYAPLSQRRPA